MICRTFIDKWKKWSYLYGGKSQRVDDLSDDQEEGGKMSSQMRNKNLKKSSVEKKNRHQKQ